MNFKYLLFFTFLLSFHYSYSFKNTENPITNFKVEAPEYVIGEQFAEIKLEALSHQGTRDSSLNGKYSLLVNGETNVVEFLNGIAFFTIQITATQNIQLKVPGSDLQTEIKIRFLPPWLSIIPPVVAILLALLTKEVIVSLFISLFMGVLILKGFELTNIIPSLLTVLDTYILDALNDKRHLSVIIFSFLIGGMVSIISQNGGIRGMVTKLSRWAHSPRSSQIITFFLSFGIFYDNYANTLIVGNTMRSVTDRFKVSREKLAFIVHGTAASVSAVAFVTTWIGAELGFINDATSNLGIDEKTYSLFLKSLQFAYYPIFMLFFIFFLILLKKDYGPMNLAEIESRNAGIIHANKEKNRKDKEEIEEDIKMLEPNAKGRPSWLKAFIPIVAVILAAFAGLLITGAKHSYEELLRSGVKLPDYSFSTVWSTLDALDKNKDATFFSKLGILISSSDFYIALLWSSFAGIFFAVLSTMVQKGISIRSTMENMVQGFRIMLSAVIILVFAWALGAVIEDLHTSHYLTTLISSKFIYPQLLPVIIFILSALFSFGIGSIWGTMAILYPLLLPVTWIICLNTGMSEEASERIMYAVVAVIITGSVFGNHCSPISDTTFVSSISSNCDQVSHVKTQLPYAFTVAAISILMLLFSLLDLHWSINFLVGIGILFLIVKYLGKTIE